MNFNRYYILILLIIFVSYVFYKITSQQSTSNRTENFTDYDDKSYSQFKQDLWVLQNTGYKKNGFYLEIGVHDGKEGSNTYLLDTKYKWKGLCIDILLDNMEERSCMQHKGLVSNKIEEVDFVFAEGLSGIDGLNLKWNNTPLVKNGKKQKFKTEITQTVLDKYNVPSFVDYLSLDVEGSELLVLEGINHKKHVFGIISIEHNNMDKMRNDIYMFLTEKGYMRVATLGVDDIYVPKK